MSLLRPLAWLLLAVAGTALPGFVNAQVLTGGTPEQLEGVTVEEHLGDKIDQSLAFVDQEGNAVTLADYLSDGKPVALTLNYYRCTMLCSLQLNALVDTLGLMGWSVGEHYRMLTVSIDPQDDPVVAAGKRKGYLDMLGQPDADWDFLSGRQDAISALASQVGFQYKYDEESGEYAHPAVLYVLSPDGTISRYLYGIVFPPQDLKFALMEATQGKVGSTVDRILLSCFHYISSEGRYTPWAFGVMRLGAGIGLFLLAIFLSIMFARERLGRAKQPQLTEATT